VLPKPGSTEKASLASAYTPSQMEGCASKLAVAPDLTLVTLT